MKKTNMTNIIKAENTKKKNIRIYIATLIAVQMLMMPLAGCASSGTSASASQTPAASSSVMTLQGDDDASVSTVSKSSDGTLSADDLFSDRDLAQTVDTSESKTLTLQSGSNITITEAGIYIIKGSAKDSTIIVEAGSDDKVQLVLDGVTIANSDFPCIYVKQADKVFVTLTGDNSLSVTGSFTTDGDTKTDGVVFSKDDLVFNGSGSLTISSTDNGIVAKDDLKFTGGSYTITAASKAVEANDSIRISDGTFNLKAGTDGLHAENDDDDTLGYIYIGGGTFNITAGDDGIHGTSIVQIDGGHFTVSGAECIEGTYIRINDGTFSLSSWDDGINAAQKSKSYTPTVEINGGSITITMSAGDTDGIDSNGNIIVNGGTINITGNSSFDYDGTAQFNGGTIIVNGQQLDSIPNQMMGGRGGMNGGGMGGRNMDGGNMNGGNMNGGNMNGGNTNGGNMNGGRMGGGRMGGRRS